MKRTLLFCSVMLAMVVPVFGAKPKVVTTFTVLRDMAANVAGDAAVVESITKPGAEIHDYEPTPQDLVKIRDAKLILRNGLGLERWFERFYAPMKSVPSAVLSDGVKPLDIRGGSYDGKPNPHAWMSPSNALIYVENIRKALTQIDPENAAVYAANAAAYAEKIRALDTPIREKIARIPEAQRWLVTGEGAFSYLTSHYGMKELYLWPVNADGDGTPKQVRRLIDTVREHRVPVVFSESTVSDKPMRSVAKQTGARYGGVLYVDSLTDENGPAPSYLKLLEHNAKTLVDGFEVR